MHIRSKFDGGKQINRIQGGSWQARCAGAGLRCNEGADWGPKAWKQALSIQPSHVFQNTSEVAVKQTDKTRKRKATDKAKSQRKRSRYNGNDNTLNSRRAYSRYNKHPQCT